MPKDKRGGRRGGSTAVDSATSIVTQSGDTADLSAYPLVYGQDTALPPNIKSVIDDFEKRRVKNKVEHGTLVAADGTVLIEKRGGSGSVSMPVRLYNQAQIMSHIHPRAGSHEAGTIGGTFSDGDIDTFVTTGIKTMRAAGAEGTYSITKGANFNANGLTNYYASIHRTASTNDVARRAKLNSDIRAGRIGYKEYNKQWNDSFNQKMVEVHNGLLAGASQYGYTYALERR